MASAGNIHITWQTPRNALLEMEERGLRWSVAHKTLIQWAATGNLMLISRGAPIPAAHIAGAAFDHNDLRCADRTYPDVRVDWTTGRELLEQHFGKPTPAQMEPPPAQMVPPIAAPAPAPRRRPQQERVLALLRGPLCKVAEHLSGKALRRELRKLDCVADRKTISAALAVFVEGLGNRGIGGKMDNSPQNPPS